MRLVRSTPIRLLAYFVLVLIVATVVGWRLFSRSKSKASNASPDETRISETSFRLTLPGKWTSGPSNDPTRRQYYTGSENLTVSIHGSLFGTPNAMSSDDKMARFAYWVRKRRDAEAEALQDNTIRITEPQFGEFGGVLAARYAGFDEARRRRFHCLLLASSSAFEVFYYEAVDMTEQAAELRAKAIFNSVDIPK